MTTAGTAPSQGPKARTVRLRDAAASRLALLEAAQELFGKAGFESTTVREIGDRAGVDAALIARYFGSKADLYIAAVVAEDSGDPSPAAFESLGQIVEAMVTRTDEHGPGPIMQALIRADTSEEIRRAAQSRLRWRLVEPIAVGMENRGIDRPWLRAELVVTAMIGVSLGRSLGWLEEIRSVPRDELVELIADALGALTKG